MKNGFYVELNELQKDYPEADFGFLENTTITKDFHAWNYLHGQCADFCAMLSHVFGYRIEAVRHVDDGEPGRLIHAYCVTNIGSKKAYIDVRGITTDPVLFFEEFENEVTYYPEDGELYDLYDKAIVETWASKDELFDGDYEGFVDEEIIEFIRWNRSYFDTKQYVRLNQEPNNEGKSNLNFRVMDMNQIGSLYHVGTLDISKKSKFSLEGNGLSVSNCPDSWCRITEGFTHGDYVLLSKKNMKLLDFYSLTDDEKSLIKKWAVKEEYVFPGELYKYITSNEEGDECYSLFKTYEEALYEADGDENCVEKISGFLPTNKMLEESMVTVDLLNIMDFITCLYAEQVLAYDGVYWDEELCEAIYSAPRGVIFNSKLCEFEIINVSKEQKNSFEEKSNKKSLSDILNERTCYHVTLMENVASIRENGLVPMVGERSQELGEPNAAIYLFPTKVAMDNALLNWLGEWYNKNYGEDCELAILKILVPPEIALFYEGLGFELICKETIPSRYITFYDEYEKELKSENYINLFRYELYCEDEPQDVGFLVGIEDIGLSCEKEYNILKPFDEELINPILPAMRTSVSFFTELGNAKFKDAIKEVIRAYEDSVFDVKVVSLALPKEMLDRAIYKDDFQVCLPKELYFRELSSLKKIKDPFEDIYEKKDSKSLEQKIKDVSSFVLNSHVKSFTYKDFSGR